MKPYKVELYVYAENDDEVTRLQQSAKAFVRKKFEQGVLITANKLSGALQKFENSIIVNQYFK